ncbi:sulfotransferase family 2 domain-containing protein [Neokomagataea anthophila]|uniref:Sulfotransferase family 2 domain-containing protein n=1 Tax=Neokomagataea anthophila TaxID=2826925 RepID=A0ABS5E4I0_9PROT|nr:sulfotransferase family 2 domain-containing protein [Neokomagataea anthophila]MBR0558804.1 sulfotransferase family 2 domain-containing protein [Neokomagataea anthophila]
MNTNATLTLQDTLPITPSSLPYPTRDDWAHRALSTLFRVQQFNDIHERAADLKMPLPCGGKRKRRLETILKSGVLFVHVPKNGGTSICDQLYGGIMMHESIRYYQHVAPDMVRILPSFAIWRDPVERFISAWSFARRGGTQRVNMHPSVNALYRTLHTLDDAITLVEKAPSPYDVDHIFRPQHWYLCNRQGELAVSKLFSMAQINDLPQHIPQLKKRSIPHLNKNAHALQVTEEQKHRIRALYAKDETLRTHLT